MVRGWEVGEWDSGSRWADPVSENIGAWGRGNSTSTTYLVRLLASKVLPSFSSNKQPGEECPPGK